jgi:hypothetical protein
MLPTGISSPSIGPGRMGALGSIVHHVPTRGSLSARDDTTSFCGYEHVGLATQYVGHDENRRNGIRS